MSQALDKIAKEISFLDFSEVNVDDTDEAIINLAIDLYGASLEQAEEICNIVMNKYINNIK